jgi:asparagine synthase (glutamine-hydrolysing)
MAARIRAVKEKYPAPSMTPEQLAEFNKQQQPAEEPEKLSVEQWFDEQKNIIQKKYWELDITTKNDFNPQKASQIFKELFYNSVKKRLRSDVPVGSSLSGGLDSSSVVAAISQYTINNYTFSARFPGFSKDEGVFINEVVSKFKTKHHNIEINEKGILEDLDKLIEHQEEPFQTGSIYAQYCVYREARKNGIIVMLDGQGADEFLCGYDKDFKFYLKEIYKNKNLSQRFKENIQLNHNYNLALSYKDLSSLIFPNTYKVITQFKKKLLPTLNPGINADFFGAHKSEKNPFREFNSLKEMLKYELTNQGLEKLLKFADRNSMAHSVEVRLPFLNHELIEFVLGLNAELILKNGWSKAILRDAMENELPNNITRRKDKIGFEAPHNQWTKANEFQNLVKDSKSFLIKNNIITNEFTNDWKTIITAKFLQSK